MTDWNNLRDAFAPAPEHFTLRMQATFEHMEELTVKRRHRITLAALVAVLVLLLGVALAAGSFGVLDFLARPNEDGTKTVNEALVEHVQDVKINKDGTASQVQVLDAICDGNTLSLAWSLENLSDQNLFVTWDALVDGGERHFNGGSGTGYEFFVEAGKAMDGGFSYNLDPVVTEGSVEVQLSFRVMSPKGEVVKGQALSDTMTEEEQRAALEKTEAEAKSGKLVVIGGEIELPAEMLAEGESKADSLERLGLMETVDSFEIAFTLKTTGATRSLLPQGAPEEKRFEGYRMILSQADLSPTRLQFTVEYVFDGEAELERFQRERPYMTLWPQAQDGENWYATGNGTDEDPQQRQDGTIVVRYHYTLSELLRSPESITIMAESDRQEGGRNVRAPHPEESFTLRLAP
ncbi:MAG: hypothetical protein VB099_02495 [Candidatus Limiplasma sp.]|nr:hypothetical protein [Candidatus Limiplasma sp.]